MLLYRYAEKKEVDNTQSTTIMTMHLCSVKNLHGASCLMIITTPGVTVFIRDRNNYKQGEQSGNQL